MVGWNVGRRASSAPPPAPAPRPDPYRAPLHKHSLDGFSAGAGSPDRGGDPGSKPFLGALPLLFLPLHACVTAGPPVPAASRRGPERCPSWGCAAPRGAVPARDGKQPNPRGENPARKGTSVTCPPPLRDSSSRPSDSSGLSFVSSSGILLLSLSFFFPPFSFLYFPLFLFPPTENKALPGADWQH